MILSYEEVIKLPSRAAIEIACYDCKKPIQSSPRYIKKKLPDKVLCLSCLNLSRGDSIKQKISDGVKRVHGGDEGRKKLSDSVKKRIEQGWKPIVPQISAEKRAEVGRRLWGNDEFRAKQVAAGAWKQSPEARARMSASNKEAWSDETKRKALSDAAKKRWDGDADLRARHAAYKTADWREKQRSDSKRRWENPAYRARQEQLAKERANDPLFLAHMQRMRDAMPKVSRLTDTVSGILNELGVVHSTEFKLGPYSFDILVPSKNLLLELNGEYWHNLPVAIRNDKAKATYIARYHSEYELRYIWEVDFFKQGRVRHVIEKLLGVVTDAAPVDFSKLMIEDSDPSAAALFYSQHHYMSTARGGVHYKLIHNNEVIGSCSFSRFQRREQEKKFAGCVELSRFCLHSNYNVRNLASWFLSRCIKMVGKPVVTYADEGQGHDGTIYKACNFTLSHVVEPDYFYVDAGGWVMHKRTLWGRASKMSMTEQGYADKHGFSKKWGGPKSCFVYGI